MIMSSSTRTVPASQTRPRSLRSRSISMMCSARSLGCATSAAHLAQFLARAAAARPRAGDGPRVDPPAGDAHQPLGRGAEERARRATAPARRTAPDWRAQTLVQRRRGRGRCAARGCGARPDAPGTRQVGLVDVAGADVLLGAHRPAPGRPAAAPRVPPRSAAPSARSVPARRPAVGIRHDARQQHRPPGARPAHRRARAPGRAPARTVCAARRPARGAAPAAARGAARSPRPARSRETPPSRRAKGSRAAAARPCRLSLGRCARCATSSRALREMSSLAA